MESDESRPGSSASNSSSSSSAESNENVENGSASSSRKSRSKSVNSVNSNSSSASSSRDNSPESQTAASKGTRSVVDDDGVNSATNDFENAPQRSRSASQESNQSESSNSNSSNAAEKSARQSVSRNQSMSPVRRGSKSSRNSSVSSIGSNDERSKASENGNDPDSNPEKLNGSNKEPQQRNDLINISHDDLSDVSDLDSAVASPAASEKADDEEQEDELKKASVVDLRQKLDERKKTHDQKDAHSKQSPSIVDEINDIMDKKHDEDALDFEAEDGECNDEKEDKPEPKEAAAAVKGGEQKDSDGEIGEDEELEEGEVSDEGEKRPEETEPKPVCRFYARGQCTWGMSCRFLHPGVTDKGNYTMFEMIRPVPITHSGPYGPPGGPGFHDYRSERPPIHHPAHGFPGGPPGPHQRPPAGEPVVESAWERGLRTAKEMMRKANKRKEQDMDFEDKKMNLSASQEEFEKDNYYIRERSPEISPPPPFPARPPAAPPAHHAYGAYSPPPKYGPGRMAPPPYEEDAYGRSMRYRELPAHRMPQYEDEMIAGKRRVRPTREVIVQRVEPPGRGDEWNDPWMRSKSPGREKRQKRKSYSSNSSYSSSR